MQIKIKKNDDEFYFRFEPDSLYDSKYLANSEQEYFEMMINSLQEMQANKPVSEIQSIVRSLSNEAKSNGLTNDILKSIIGKTI